MESEETDEICIICGGNEPCSHDFDELNKQLADLGSIMGTANNG